MAFDLAAWAVIFMVASVVGRGALSLLDATGVRVGDRRILAAWIGVIGCAVSLLGVSLFTALTPKVSVCAGMLLCALGAAATRSMPRQPSPPTEDVALPGWAIVIGVVVVAIGAAALASDPVTLYDSLVYHVGVIRWLREIGTVPGMALIHNRLGHVSAWFTLAAAFDAGPAANRAANVPLGFALLLTGVQTALATARIAVTRARISDWFLAFGSAALIWAISVGDAASPSPDIATNALILVAAWSVLIVSPPPTSFTRRLIPFVIALGACSMKLFAVPAAIATGSYAVLASPGDARARLYVRRVLVCAGLAVAIVGPFVAANLVASGCPAYPSPIGCLAAPWSVGATRAADYSAYVRDVARWQRRGEASVGASVGWIGPWVIDHPLIAVLVVACLPLGIRLLRRVATVKGERQTSVGVDGVRAVVAFAVVGAAFGAWQAPAPRFMYAYLISVPALTLALTMHVRASDRIARPPSRRRRAIGFAATSVVVGSAYAVASQKLNVRSALMHGAPIAPVARADLVVPAGPELPARLFRWRVNDVDVLTPVPRPVADTLGYRSAIRFNSSLEKCSAAPLPCTPYLPGSDVRLRRPASGLAGGFVRERRPELAGPRARCVGELSLTGTRSASFEPVPPVDQARCGDDRR
jgi:hypothetical protein